MKVDHGQIRAQFVPNTDPLGCEYRPSPGRHPARNGLVRNRLRARTWLASLVRLV
jgi:hypothetical protein